MKYILANPTGNITALVTEWGNQNGGVAVSNADRNERLAIVKEIFDTEPSCEQVGFVRVTGPQSITLEMMGGEFCGNATLSAAAYCAKTNKLFSGGSEVDEKSLVISVDSSGTDKPVPVVLRCLDAEAGEYEGTLEMAMPQLDCDGSVDICNKLPGRVVHLDGISHMVVPAESLSHEEAEAVIKNYAKLYDALAFGILLYSDGDNSVSIEPLVYVKGSGTMVWEHGCASGSIAAAYYKYSEIAKNDNKDASKVSVCQPGGVITIEITGDKLYLTGKIKL